MPAERSGVNRAAYHCDDYEESNACRAVWLRPLLALTQLAMRRIMVLARLKVISYAL
jgi:hypothetical protein